MVWAIGAIKCGTGLSIFRVLSFFYPAHPPPLGVRGDLGLLATPTVAQGCDNFVISFFGGISSPRSPRYSCGATLIFCFTVDRFSPRTPLSGDIAVGFIGGFPVPYR